nr:hypothetical protein [Spiroplasma corruscae]
MSKIIEGKLNKVSKTLQVKHNLELDFKENLLNICDLVKSHYKPQMGGRGIVNAIDDIFIGDLSNFLFENLEKIKNSKELLALQVKVKGDKFIFELK